MTSYLVEVEETVITTYEVEAQSEEDAKEEFFMGRSREVDQDIEDSEIINVYASED